MNVSQTTEGVYITVIIILEGFTALVEKIIYCTKTDNLVLVSIPLIKPFGLEDHPACY